jgi:hypothetical protein
MKIHSQIKDILDTAAKTLNPVKAIPVNSRNFRVQSEDVSNVHLQILLHAEGRWMSTGRKLINFCELCMEVQLFLSESSFELMS